jgi:hypothetical protein
LEFLESVAGDLDESPETLGKVWDSISSEEVRNFIRAKFPEDSDLLTESEPLVLEALVYRKHGLHKQASELLNKALAAAPERRNLAKVLATLGEIPSQPSEPNDLPSHRKRLSLREVLTQGVVGLITGSIGFGLLLALAYLAPRIYLVTVFIFLALLRHYWSELIRQKGSTAQRVVLVYLLTLIPCVLLALDGLSN